jgi:predicted ATPase
LLEARRLVTITGPGGIGKTRLALRAAELMRPLYRDGVRLADLSRASDGTAIQRLTRVSDLRSTCQQLVVLDNCEHLVLPNRKTPI